MKKLLAFGIAVILSGCGGDGASPAGGGGGGNGGAGNGNGGSGGGNTTSYAVGGTVGGLSGSGLVVQDNGSDDLPLSANGAFTFATSVAAGGAYAVTVKTQPTNPAQTCAITNGTGTIGGANVTNIVLTCTNSNGGGTGGGTGGGGTTMYTVGGMLSGLTGTGLVLQNNGADDLPLTANGSFSFAKSLASDTPYSVTVKTQPTGPNQTCVVTNGSGVGTTSAITDVTVDCKAIAVIGGAIGGPGFRDGTGAGARFNSPARIVADSAGNLFVTDAPNHVIRKISPTGVVTTLAGKPGQPGYADGTGAMAQFNNPSGLAIDSTGNLYVADGDNQVIRKVTPAAVVSTIAGTAGSTGSADGHGAAARFLGPRAVALDKSGNLYIADSGNNTIRKMTAAGDVSTVAGTAGQHGSVDAAGAAARFYLPLDIAADANYVYVADSLNNEIRRVTPAGSVSTLAGTTTFGKADGTGPAAQFNGPRGIAVDAAGNVYVGDSNNGLIRKITPAGVVTTLAGGGNASGSGTSAGFHGPAGVLVTATGVLYVADSSNGTIRKIAPDLSVTTIAGAPSMSGLLNSESGPTLFSTPEGIAADTQGNLYVADSNNSVVRKIAATGAVTTFSDPGASIPTAWGTAIDSKGNLFVAAFYEHTIRKVAPDGTVTVFAGLTGASGSLDGQGTGARFNRPAAVAIDGLDNLFVTDTSNYTIRKITPAGVVTTFAGSGVPGPGDGAGAAAQFNGNYGITVDNVGNVYVTEIINNTIRKITPAGAVSTFAGHVGASGSVDGIGDAARFTTPVGIAADSMGNLYLADTGNALIRKISSTAEVTTVAGTRGVFAVTPGALPGSLNQPQYIAVLPGPGTTLAVTDENAVLKIGLP